MLEQWTDAIDSIVPEILKRAKIEAPPIETLQVARALEIEIVFDADQSTRARQKSLSGQKVIFLKPDQRPERLHWAAAHELGEIHAWQIFDRVGMDANDAPEGLREQVANLFATRLLLPETWFRSDANGGSADLFDLKRLYKTASHELIARRLMKIDPDLVLTILDQGKATTRQNGWGRRLPSLTQLERECWEAIHASGGREEISESGCRVRGWAIHEPEWKREILLARFSEDFFQSDSL